VNITAVKVCLLLDTKQICTKILTRKVNSAYEFVSDEAHNGFGEGRHVRIVSALQSTV
jgi:hypothetical protein